MPLEWYSKCIQGCPDLVFEASEEVYIKLLCFLAEKWDRGFDATSLKHFPILKYVSWNKNIEACSINKAALCGRNGVLCSQDKHIDWLINWNGTLNFASDLFFMPGTTQMALKRYCKSQYLKTWLHDRARVEEITIYEFIRQLLRNMKESKDRNLIIGFTHFLYHSLQKKFISEADFPLCASMPVIDSCGNVHIYRKGLLVPSSISNWAKLLSKTQ
ncbi:hypothetical protein AMTR_s00016p00192500 [Amborella trichopoda]|uniref:Uncharacterized protein n=1 Tax=Amborella trichopoda TaxID=13333 RepID=W1PF43_AMBTC|nr:hypothetical protein AMTR_s00016p00192500 [Amborella trichopoda]